MKEQELYKTLEAILTTIANHNNSFKSIHKKLTLFSDRIDKLEREIEKKIMTREEQIKQQADTYIGHPRDIGEDITISNERNAFIEGAEWADENPNQSGKELLYVAQKTAGRTKKEFIEKTKKWMKEQCYQEFGGGPLERLIPDELIEDYIKTMEE